MKNILKKTEEAVREAGGLFFGGVEGYGSDGENGQMEIIQKDGDMNFVTSIDLAVQDFMADRLIDILPGSNLITEESEDNLYKFEKPTWILDPVDGTTNLMYDYRMSALSLALVIEGELRAGFIYNPFSGEMFTAQQGMGAFLNGRRIRVRKTADFSKCLIGFGTTPYDRSLGNRTFDITKKIFMDSREVRRSGSAAIDIAYVACGRLEGFYELRLQPWDYAAGILIIQEAGGKITNWEGRPADLLKPDSIAASNGMIHGTLLGYLAE